MRKVLVALFVIMILSIGVYGVADSTNNPEEVIEEEKHSTEIQLGLVD